MKKRHPRTVAFAVFAIIICISVVLDRITKSLAVLHLSGGKIQPFIPGFLDFQLVYNRGAAWGILEGGRGIFLIIASFTLIAMFIYLAINTRHSTFEVIALGLIAGGAIGNGIDRAISGEVVDFIHTLFISFPLFNIADSSITVGAILFIVVLLFGQQGVKKPENAESPADAGQGDGTGAHCQDSDVTPALSLESDVAPALSLESDLTPAPSPFPEAPSAVNNPEEEGNLVV